MSFLDSLLGKSLSSEESKKEELTIATAVPILGLDALSSTAYGPEAALMILLPLGTFGLHYLPILMIGIVATLVILYLSYLQTAAAYPKGGGAYTVASDNLGKRTGLLAAVALLLDYLLNVAVGISAGVGAMVSAFPSLYPHTLSICLFVLATLTILNLRGLRQTGLTFIIPTVIFVACIGVAIVIGLIQVWQSAGSPQPVISPPSLPAATTTLSMWMLLGAFANGLTAMTGVEAVSNAVPLFRQPSVLNARLTLSVIVGILALFLLGIGYLCPAYHIGAMDESVSGYQTMLSQLVAAISGRGVFYHVAIISIFIVLTYSAQTSFADFPRVCRLLAEDGFLPRFLAEKGRRLVYSSGIIILSLMSGLLLVLFKGMTMALIPLFAIGAFSAFFFSQTGMVVYWLRKRGRAFRVKLLFNALGAITTAIALTIIIIEKFMEGAWIIVLVAPLLVLLLSKIQRHYKKVSRQIDHPIDIVLSKLQAPMVIIPIEGWDQVAKRALELGILISNEIIAVHISSENEAQNKHPLTQLWKEKVENPAKLINAPIPLLKIIYSPYRWIYQPILDLISETRKAHPERLIAVIIPELVEPHWYEYVLHNIHAAGLRTLLFLKRDQQIIVINSPWYLSERTHYKL